MLADIHEVLTEQEIFQLGSLVNLGRLVPNNNDVEQKRIAVANFMVQNILKDILDHFEQKTFLKVNCSAIIGGPCTTYEEFEDQAGNLGAIFEGVETTYLDQVDDPLKVPVEAVTILESLSVGLMVIQSIQEKYSVLGPISTSLLLFYGDIFSKEKMLSKFAEVIQLLQSYRLTVN